MEQKDVKMETETTQLEQKDEKLDAAPGQIEDQQKTESPAAQLDLAQLKMVAGQQLEAWLQKGAQAKAYVESTKVADMAYELTDPYVHYKAKYEQVKQHGESLLEKAYGQYSEQRDFMAAQAAQKKEKITTQVTEAKELALLKAKEARNLVEEQRGLVEAKVTELKERLVLFYDEASNYVGMLLEVLPERQGELLKYVKETYSNVRLFVQENWLRLDFNQDGGVSLDDLRKSVAKLYEFLTTFDYLEAKTRIQSSLYAGAVKLLPAKAREASAGAAPLQVEQETKDTFPVDGAAPV